MVRLQGSVARGTGRSSGCFASGEVLTQALRAELPPGARLHPGTINVLVPVAAHVELRTPRPFLEPTELSPEFIRLHGVAFRPCTLNGTPAFIVRTQWPGSFHNGVDMQADETVAQFEIVSVDAIDGIASEVAVTLVFDESVQTRRGRVTPNP